MKKIRKQERNWLLVTVACVMIIVNLALLFIVMTNAPTLGWWALLIAAGAVTSISFAVVAIRRNDPAWLLLDLILPN